MHVLAAAQINITQDFQPFFINLFCFFIVKSKYPLQSPVFSLIFIHLFAQTCMTVDTFRFQSMKVFCSLVFQLLRKAMLTSAVVEEAYQVKGGKQICLIRQASRISSSQAFPILQVLQQVIQVKNIEHPQIQKLKFAFLFKPNTSKISTSLSPSKNILMRRLFQEEAFFNLPGQQPNAQSRGSLSNVQSQAINSGENLTQTRNQREKQMQEMAQGIMAMVCGCIFFCFTVFVGLCVGYYFFWDSIKSYLYPQSESPSSQLTAKVSPNLQQQTYSQTALHLQEQQMILNELNAHEYFSRFPVYAGQLHYARIPLQYWEHRMLMLKSMGLNSLSVYVFWNYHEQRRGQFDFATGNKNLSHFLYLARKHQMRVLIRPGPYVCAQWDWGGLPLRLMAIQNLKIRSSNSLFLEETRLYFKELSKVIQPYIKSPANKKGPIILIQVQNEPGWFTDDKLYIRELKKMWEEIEINCPLYFDDNINFYQDRTLYWKNAILAVNQALYRPGSFEFLEVLDHVVFGGEVYSGWFSEWGQPYQTKEKRRYQRYFASQFSDLLKDKKSFSIYMAHGGTNFGLTAGYNLVTSYDYFAPVSQQGGANPKYHIFRSLFTNFTKQSLPQIPNPVPTMRTQYFQVNQVSSLFDNLPPAQASDLSANKLLNFESKQLQMFNQGLLMYESKLKGPRKYSFRAIVHDFAIIYVDGKFITQLRRTMKDKIDIPIFLELECGSVECSLQILVEALGHMNFGPEMTGDYKGLLEFTEVQGRQLHEQVPKVQLKWQYRKFEMQNQPEWVNQGQCSNNPCLYYAQIDLEKVSDTYLNMERFKKGYVWVNGKNLGRYWKIGPQKKLYCPGVWLKQGKNKILVLDLLTANENLSLVGEQQLY